jgi:hypothetical protein
MAADFRQQVELAHVAEKWRPVFRQGHARDQGGGRKLN